MQRRAVLSQAHYTTDKLVNLSDNQLKKLMWSFSSTGLFHNIVIWFVNNIFEYAVHIWALVLDICSAVLFYILLYRSLRFQWDIWTCIYFMGMRCQVLNPHIQPCFYVNKFDNLWHIHQTFLQVAAKFELPHLPHLSQLWLCWFTASFISACMHKEDNLINLEK